MLDQDDNLIIVGRFGASYGVKGWMKVHSFTQPHENIITYQPWLIKQQARWQPVSVTDCRQSGNNILAAIAGCETKEATSLYRNVDIAIQRQQLPALNTGEFYWADLQGLSVYTVSGDELGKIDYILPTGANDVLVVKGKREHLIPYLPNDVIKEIDLVIGKIIVDWDANF